MKKLFVIALAMLMLCACGVREKPAVDEPPADPAKEESEEPKTELFTAANGKSGVKYGGKVIIEPEYHSLELYDDFILAKNEAVVRVFGYDGVQKGFDYKFFRQEEGTKDEDGVWYIGVVSEGTMKIINQKNDEPLFEEVPDERYYLISKEGIPFFDVPLENYMVMTEADEPGKLFVYGTAKGNRYEGWSRISGGEKVEEMEETTPKTFVDEFGYEHTGFYANWYGGYMKHGLNIGGEVFIEPVYSGLTVPFEDRIILWYSAFMQGQNCGYCRMIDLDKNALTDDYNRIDFIELENGYYAAVAVSYGSDSEDPIFDRNGEPMPEGIWFIDKDGNGISKTMGLVQKKDGFEYEGYNVVKEAVTSINDVITVLDENGEEMKIAIKDYAFKP